MKPTNRTCNIPYNASLADTCIDQMYSSKFLLLFSTLAAARHQTLKYDWVHSLYAPYICTFLALRDLIGLCSD